MKKIKTKLVDYKYNNTILQSTPVDIVWYVLQSNGQIDKGRCFSESELQKFLAFINANVSNFPGTSNALDCNEENTPFCTAYITSPQVPDNLILRSNPNLSSRVSKCMDIILCNSRGIQNHTYNLEFDVIGELLK